MTRGKKFFLRGIHKKPKNFKNAPVWMVCDIPVSVFSVTDFGGNFYSDQSWQGEKAWPFHPYSHDDPVYFLSNFCNGS
jgi:hypothetical protein